MWIKSGKHEQQWLFVFWSFSFSEQKIRVFFFVSHSNLFYFSKISWLDIPSYFEYSKQTGEFLRKWTQPGVDFTNVLRKAFMSLDPKRANKTDSLTVFFALLESARVKASPKMLVKLTPARRQAVWGDVRVLWLLLSRSGIPHS